MQAQMMCPSCGKVIAAHAIMKGKKLTIDEQGCANTEIKCPDCKKKLSVSVVVYFHITNPVNVEDMLDELPDGFQLQEAQEIMNTVMIRMGTDGKGYTREQFKQVAKKRYKQQARYKDKNLDQEIDTMVDTMYAKWWFLKDQG